MMQYQIFIEKKAQKFIKRLSKQDKERLLKAIYELPKGDIKPIQGYVSSWKLLERLGFQRIRQLDNQSYKNDEIGNPILISTFLYELDKAKYNKSK